MRNSNVARAADTDFRALSDEEIDFVAGGGSTTTTIKVTTPLGGFEITRTETDGGSVSPGNGGDSDGDKGPAHDGSNNKERPTNN